jgi:hypothetical protein
LRASVSSPVRQPASYNLPTFPSWAPTSYRLSYDAGKDEYTISVGPFVLVPPPVEGAAICKPDPT